MSDLIWLTDRQMQRIEPFSRFVMGSGGLMNGAFNRILANSPTRQLANSPAWPGHLIR